MILINIVPVTGEHIAHVARYMCEEDRNEVHAASGLSPLAALRSSVDVPGAEAFAVLPLLDGEPGKPVAIFGVSSDPFTEGVGVVWMLTTKMLLSTSKDILRQAPAWFVKWTLKYPKGLHNVIDVRNSRHVKWLGKIGCRFDKRIHILTTPEGVNVPFMHFSYTPRIQLLSA